MKETKNFYDDVITNIRRVIKPWELRKLTLEGKIVIFETIALSKIVSQTFIITLPNHTIKELQKGQKEFLWRTANPMVKHDTVYSSYKQGSLKNT